MRKYLKQLKKLSFLYLKSGHAELIKNNIPEVRLHLIFIHCLMVACKLCTVQHCLSTNQRRGIVENSLCWPIRGEDDGMLWREMTAYTATLSHAEHLHQRLDWWLLSFHRFNPYYLMKKICWSNHFQVTFFLTNKHLENASVFFVFV